MGQSWCGTSQKEIQEIKRSEQFCDKCNNGFIWDEIGWSAIPCECEKNKQN